jgi:hypothetical protein
MLPPDLTSLWPMACPNVAWPNKNRRAVAARGLAAEHRVGVGGATQ